VQDFIAEHHGDRVIQVFYHKAVEMAGEGEEVDVARFQYAGPRPQSRESGIVQLADSIDAASNAMRPNTEKEIEQLVNGIVDDHMAEGQLDNSGLSLGDIKLLRSSFIETLHGRYHMRVKYPGNEEDFPSDDQEIEPLQTDTQPDVETTAEESNLQELDEPV
jgi:membrane-associated HD superfamily phosphohydrolase